MQGIPPPPDKRVTLNNWNHPPFNRWTFQHVSQIAPTIAVSRGSGPVWQLTAAHQDFDDLEVIHRRNGNRRSVREILEQTYTDGFLVIHADRIVYERYFNDMEATTLHLSQSVAKSITAAVCGIVIHRDGIDRDAPLSSIVPELSKSGYADASLRQVLDMRSGVQFNEDYTDPDSDIALVEHIAAWKQPRSENCPTSVLDIPCTLPKVRQHGGHFEYRSIETDVMAWVIQRSTGERLAGLVSELLWQPMGAQSDANFTVDAAGYALAEGGFNATLEDYARFGLLYLRDGFGCAKQIIPAEWVNETFTAGDTEAFAHSAWAEFWPRGAYKNQFWIQDVDRGRILARGVFGQAIVIDKTSDLVAVSLSSWPDFVNQQFVLDELDAIDAIAKELD